MYQSNPKLGHCFIEDTNFLKDISFILYLFIYVLIIYLSINKFDILHMCNSCLDLIFIIKRNIMFEFLGPVSNVSLTPNNLL